MKRDIIVIDERVCDGCGLCCKGCPEGALAIVNGKAKLIAEILCDGLGACMGVCPVGAIRVERKDAAPYSETETMTRIAAEGPACIVAHLNHLASHGQKRYLQEALDFLEKNSIAVPDEWVKKPCARRGGRTIDSSHDADRCVSEAGSKKSQLRQWPVQLRLVNSQAPYLDGADVLLSADCVAYAVGDFHEDYLKGKALVIACPKLDNDRQVYIDTLADIIDNARIQSLTVMIMEVPCCGGLVALAQKALEQAKRTIAVAVIVVGLAGNIVRKEALG